jgi:hypothetical protein
MPTQTYNMKAKEKEIIFSRPYLNDNKELTFRNCSEFTRFPNMEFVLCEGSQSIELRNPGSKKKVFLLLKGNEHLLKEASKEKENIMDLLRDFTKSLSSGMEKVIVRETKNKEYPYYFTTHMIEEHGDRSCKFVAGFIYFLNQRLKEAKVDFQFDDFSAMQQRLGQHFQSVGLDQFQAEPVGGELAFTISFSQFVRLLA